MDDLFRTAPGSQWRGDLLTLWGLTRKHVLRLLAAVVSSLLLSSINGAIAWLVKPSVDNLLIMKQSRYLYLLPLGIFCLFVFRGIFIFCNNFLMASISAKIVREMRQSLYEKLLSLPVSFFSKKSSGSLVSRLINDMSIIEGLAANTMKNFLVQSTTVLILAFVALYRNPRLALLSFIVIPIVAAATDRFGRRMKQVSAKTRELISDVTHIIHETLSGMRTIKAFTMEERMRLRNENAIGDHYRNVLREVRINESASAFVEMVAGTGVAILAWYGFHLIINEGLTMGDFLSFVVAVMMLYDPLKRLSRVNNEFQTIRAVLHRLREIFLLDPEQTGSVVRERMEGHVRFDHVYFTYPEGKEPVLSDICLEILPGETVAIVGYSGAGKSTLADLLLGYRRGYSGTITIDGLDLKDYSLKSLRSHISVVPQDVFLFDDSVRNNILFGRPGSSEADMIGAARAAYADEFISEMPHGYDSQIGERGVKLSGGQKQRISLARAIIRDPRIFILDEATSSLDSDSELKIQTALDGIMRGRTTVVIAHRLSTIQKADRIVVMDRGRIVQYGHHADLIQQPGIYRDLYALQTGLAGQG